MIYILIKHSYRTYLTRPVKYLSEINEQNIKNNNNYYLIS